MNINHNNFATFFFIQVNMIELKFKKLMNEKTFSNGAFIISNLTRIRFQITHTLKNKMVIN